jgi:hypothetical protein
MPGAFLVRLGAEVAAADPPTLADLPQNRDGFLHSAPGSAPLVRLAHRTTTPRTRRMMIRHDRLQEDSAGSEDHRLRQRGRSSAVSWAGGWHDRDLWGVVLAGLRPH